MFQFLLIRRLVSLLSYKETLSLLFPAPKLSNKQHDGWQTQSPSLRSDGWGPTETQTSEREREREIGELPIMLISKQFRLTAFVCYKDYCKKSPINHILLTSAVSAGVRMVWRERPEEERPGLSYNLAPYQYYQ